VGALETKKCYLFSGNKLEGYESFTLENCNNASEPKYPMPTTDETRVHDKTGGTETCSNKSDKNRWLEMVNGPRKRFIFQEPQNWKALEIPEEAKKYLSYNLESVSGGKSDQWFNLVS